MNGVGDSPLIHIVDSPNDTFGTDAAVFERTMDAFTAHPELNAFFLDNGGGTGAVEALDAMGLLKPVNDPDHIVLGFNDIDTRVVQAMDDGHLDVILSHIFHDLVDLAVKAMFTNLVLGESVPQDMVTPEVLITPDNIDSAKIGGVIVACISEHGRDRYDHMLAVYPFIPERFK